MTYTLTETLGELDADWAGSELGVPFDDCVTTHEMDFLLDMGEGPHSVYNSNNWYFNNVSKEEFFSDPASIDHEMTYVDWWEYHKDYYKGVAEWKNTEFTL